MIQTLASGNSLLPVGAFLERVDHRTVGDLASDDDRRVASGDLPDNPKLLACLKDASGQLEQAAMAGKRYTREDLATLAAATDTAGQAALYRLLTRLTVLFLFERRPDRELKLPEIVKQALDELTLLRNGHLIFPFEQTMNAGLMDARLERPDEVEARGGITTTISRIWGHRNNRREVQ